MSQSKDISVVIPLFNEDESLPELCQWIERVMNDNAYSYEVIFVDDGSTDKSWSVINELKSKNENVRGIKFRRNYGKSAALNTAFDVCEGQVVITMDADLQDSPDEIPELYNMIVKDGYDLVSGWKKKRHDPVLTKNLPSKFFNATARMMSGIKLHDFNCGLKAYDQQVVKNIEVYGDMHRYIPIIAKSAGFSNITEKPVTHQARKYGKSKFGINRFINGFLDLMTISFIGRFGKKPMHFFGTIGMLLLLLGLGILIYLSFVKLILGIPNISDRPMFFLGMLATIVGIQLFITGFLAELISRNAQGRNDYKIEARI